MGNMTEKRGQNVGKNIVEKWGNRKKTGVTREKRGDKREKRGAKREQKRCQIRDKIIGKKWATCEENWGNRGAKKMRES